MDKLNEPVLSLSRFLRQGAPLPSWVAGRFKAKNKKSFYLKSQGLFLLCELSGKNPAVLQAGDWAGVKLLSKKGSVYKAQGLRLMARPSKQGFQTKSFAYEKKGEVLQNWFRFLSAVSRFCLKRGMARAETPSLVKCPGTEPHLYPFKTQLIRGGRKSAMYLPTSPEMHLKKLLCQDWTDFFEIKLCARNNEIGPQHQPEFHLLEFYRAFYRLEELMEELFQLLVFLHKEGFLKRRPLEPAIYSMRELFIKHLNFNLSPNSAAQDLSLLLKENNLKAQDNNFEEAFFLLFLHCIEPKLPKSRPVFICDYPPSLRAFARLDAQGWASRFELYWRGLELANGFYEVIDPEEQKALFKEHIRQRKDSAPPPDQELLKLMEGGMPPSSGVALGLNRLFCLTQGAKDLRAIRLFPL